MSEQEELIIFEEEETMVGQRQPWRDILQRLPHLQQCILKLDISIEDPHLMTVIQSDNELLEKPPVKHQVRRSHSIQLFKRGKECLACIIMCAAW